MDRRAHSYFGRGVWGGADGQTSVRRGQVRSAVHPEVRGGFSAFRFTSAPGGGDWVFARNDAQAQTSVTRAGGVLGGRVQASIGPMVPDAGKGYPRSQSCWTPRIGCERAGAAHQTVRASSPRGGVASLRVDGGFGRASQGAARGWCGRPHHQQTGMAPGETWAVEDGVSFVRTNGAKDTSPGKSLPLVGTGLGLICSTPCTC